MLAGWVCLPSTWGHAESAVRFIVLPPTFWMLFVDVIVEIHGWRFYICVMNRDIVS
jgi:hypothetical protein